MRPAGELSRRYAGVSHSRTISKGRELLLSQPHRGPTHAAVRNRTSAAQRLFRQQGVVNKAALGHSAYASVVPLLAWIDQMTDTFFDHVQIKKPEGTARLNTVELRVERAVNQRRSDLVMSFKIKQKEPELRRLAMPRIAKHHHRNYMWPLRRSGVLRIGLNSRIAVTDQELCQEQLRP